MPVKFIYVVVIGMSVLFIVEKYFILWIYYRLHNHQPLDMKTELFLFWGVINKATANMNKLGFVWTYISISLGYTTGSRIGGSYSKYTNEHHKKPLNHVPEWLYFLHSDQQSMRVAPNPQGALR